MWNRNAVTVTATILFLCCTTCPTSEAALVGHWTFDANFDDAVSGFHGFASGAGNNVFITPGTIGGAASFDGNNDRIVIPQAVIPQANFSVSFWEFSPSTATSKSGYFLGASTNTGGDLQFFLRRFGDTTGANYAGGITQSGGNGTFGNFAVPLNAWHHNFVTHDSAGNGRWYVNGQLTATLSSGSTFTGLSHDLWVGNRADLARDFQGLIDDLAIWNTPLGQTEARAVHSLGLSLGQNSSLFDFNYNAGQVQQLFNAHAQTGSALIGDDHWTFAAGLSTISGGAQPGELFSFGGETYLLLGADTGLLQSNPIIPEPASLTLLLLGIALLSRRRSRVARCR